MYGHTLSSQLGLINDHQSAIKSSKIEVFGFDVIVSSIKDVYNELYTTWQ